MWVGSASGWQVVRSGDRRTIPFSSGHCLDVVVRRGHFEQPVPGAVEGQRNERMTREATRTGGSPEAPQGWNLAAPLPGDPRLRRRCPDRVEPKRAHHPSEVQINRLQPETLKPGT